MIPIMNIMIPIFSKHMNKKTDVKFKISASNYPGAQNPENDI